eukprot:357346-Chlamydomonas_euryale.AAC.5
MIALHTAHLPRSTLASIQELLKFRVKSNKPELPTGIVADKTFAAADEEKNDADADENAPSDVTVRLCMRANCLCTR